MNWNEHIVSDPNVCHGKPCIRGTRILVSVILDSLAAGLTPSAIVEADSSLKPSDVMAVLAYASQLSQ